MKKPPHYGVATIQTTIIALLAMVISLSSFFLSESFLHVLEALLYIHISIIATITLLLIYQYKKGYDIKATFLLLIRFTSASFS